MLKIDIYNRIFLTRGDTANIELELTAFDRFGKDTLYEVGLNDKVVLTIRDEPSYKGNLILQKDLEYFLWFMFHPEDTSSLEIGIYYYDVQLVTPEGDKYTVIPPTKFELTSEINDG